MIYQIGNFFGIRKLRDTAESGIIVPNNRIAGQSLQSAVKNTEQGTNKVCALFFRIEGFIYEIFSLI